MIVLGSCATCVWFSGEKQNANNYFLTGAAFPLLLKKALALVGHEQTLGADSDEVSGLGIYLKLL